MSACKFGNIKKQMLHSYYPVDKMRWFLFSKPPHGVEVSKSIWVTQGKWVYQLTSWNHRILIYGLKGSPMIELGQKKPTTFGSSKKAHSEKA